MKNLNIFLSFAFFLLAACVGAQFNETAPIQNQIQEQYLKTAQLYETASNDFAEKSYVFKNMKANAPLRDPYSTMSKAMEELRIVRERLETEKNRFGIFTKGQKQISSKDKAWDQEQNTIQSFNADMASFNKALAEYSRESGNFNSIVSENKMLVIAKVGEIKKRLTGVVDKGRKNLKVMDTEISAAKKLATSNGVPFDDVSSQTITADRDAFADRLKELETILSTLKNKWGAKKQLANTDPDWDQFQKLMATSEIKSKEMSDIGKRIPVELESIKKNQ